MHDRITTSEERRMVRFMTMLAEDVLALNPYDPYFSTVLPVLRRIGRTKYISQYDRIALQTANNFY